MPVPRTKISKSKRNSRRSHHALKESGTSACPKCNSIRTPHRVCRTCGFYGGREILVVE